MTDQNQDRAELSQESAIAASNGHEISLSGDNNIHQAQPIEQPSLDKDTNKAWEAYLDSKKEYYEVYRYLAEN
jgi:hypothetical protein